MTDDVVSRFQFIMQSPQIKLKWKMKNKETSPRYYSTRDPTRLATISLAAACSPHALHPLQSHVAHTRIYSVGTGRHRSLHFLTEMKRGETSGIDSMLLHDVIEESMSGRWWSRISEIRWKFRHCRRGENLAQLQIDENFADSEINLDAGAIGCVYKTITVRRWESNAQEPVWS